MKRTSTNWFSSVCRVSLLTLLLLSACKPEEYKKPSVTGYYRMESLVTNREVDLNNDGITSSNVMEEVSQSFYLVQYNFSSRASYLEIRPTRLNDTRIQHMYVPFPHPRLKLEDTDSPNGRVAYLRNDLNGIGYDYSYDERSKIIRLDRSNVDANNEEVMGQLIDIKVIEKDPLELLVSKNYYDFSTASWVRLQLTARYTKVE